MSKLNLPLLFLLLVLWLVGGTWFFDKNYQTLSADSANDASECSFPFSISDGNFNTSSKKTFFFEQSDWEPSIPAQTLASLKMIALYLSNNERKKLQLNGQYFVEELNDSDYKNIGVARAEALKKELVDYGAPRKNIIIKSSEIDQLSLSCGKIFGGVDFSFIEQKEIEPKNNIAITEKTIEQNKTKNESSSLPKASKDYSTYSTIYYKKNQFVPEIDNDLENWFKYLKEYLDDHPKARLLLMGHTDRAASDEKAIRLGKYRARKLRDVLLKYGIEKKRIKTDSKGTKKPLASNKTEEGRKKNRRVVVSFID